MSFSRWLFTLNNYSDVDVRHAITGPNDISEDAQGILVPYLRRSVVGEEVAPSTGTPHLQGFMEFTKRQSLASVKRIYPSAHWTGAKGTTLQNYRYCIKDGKFKTHGDWVDIQNKLDKRKGGVHASILRAISTGQRNDIITSETFLRHKRSYDEVCMEIIENQHQISRYQRLSSCLLSKVQMSILRRLFIQDTRKVLWIVDSTGGSGKTFLAHVLNSLYGYDLLDGVTKPCDVCALLSPSPKGIVFDVTRSDSTHFSYQVLEMLKNGFIMSGKYHGIKRVFNPVPVLVVANFEPDKSRLSEDRWEVLVINGVCEADKEPIFDAKEIWPFQGPPKEISYEDSEKENVPPRKKGKQVPDHNDENNGHETVANYDHGSL